MYLKKIIKNALISLLREKLSKKDLYDLTFFQSAEDSIFVYSSGKSATSSIRYSLKKKGISTSQTHNLIYENLNILKDLCKDNNYIDKDTLIYVLQNINIIESIDINKHKFIVPYRDPLSVLISSFFSSWEKIYKEYYKQYNFELIYKDIIETINFVSSHQFNFLCIKKLKIITKKD